MVETDPSWGSLLALVLVLPTAFVSALAAATYPATALGVGLPAAGLVSLGAARRTVARTDDGLRLPRRWRATARASAHRE